MWYGGKVIGVVHLAPLPGSPGYGGDMDAVVARVVVDAVAYAAGGAHGLIVENYGDAPFFPTVPPETVAALARCAGAVRDAVELPVGVNALRNDAAAALGVAAAVGGAFIRVNVHTGVVATDQGLLEGAAAATLRRRRALGHDVRIAADVHVKHGRPLYPDDVVAAARDTLSRGGADALIVSGRATGAPIDMDELARVRGALPGAVIFAGSGVTEDTVADVLEVADAVIVGTSLKTDGVTNNPVDEARVKRLVARAG